MSSQPVSSYAKFFVSEEEIRDALDLMEQNAQYNTESSYHPNTILYPDNKMPFRDKHLAYLKANKTTDPSLYIKNLQLRTRLRVS